MDKIPAPMMTFAICAPAIVEEYFPVLLGSI